MNERRKGKREAVCRLKINKGKFYVSSMVVCMCLYVFCSAVVLEDVNGWSIVFFFFVISSEANVHGITKLRNANVYAIDIDDAGDYQ